MMLKRFTVLVMLAIFLCGCSAQRPMRYTEEHIDKIELVISENAGEVDPPDSVIVCTLTGDEIAGFMDKIDQLICYKSFSPQGYYGTYEVRFYYSNGDVDMIGSTANGYIEDGEEICHGWYSYRTEDLEKLFEEYTAADTEEQRDSSLDS